MEAPLEARIVVVFKGDTYFKRWYCLCELRTALAPYNVLLNQGEASDGDKVAALSHLVVALPSRLTR
jgi:hypothetical protein